ncbi:MdtA/MuxA family multidrug efflux RND transporter periplasmic adaptor subunit [Pusillimonas sp. SM2304]|uniref:MdtA/MuxA family multidrug efflux RND transporter periplasmic adaptor subunit n=1 Tax=Pusillimonas sp. SM2304 TaxID=3073241 RepID=UPI0028762934|nr:MdtA/MuxA family multidrug efflux RND transporter periplasmic adaptor subunit [Pusillimonas sp. SM2304]MDS1139228.1 MdtA/MuxA family multidrug efflux RND transporter periplasmic adaptor subunit [Pusillimonas sp. SM2304]
MSDSRSEPSRRRRPYWFWLIALLLIAAGVYWWTGQDSGQKPQGGDPIFGRGMMASMPVPVKVATAETGLINHTLKAIGTVAAFNTVIVRSRVDGELQKIAFADGQKVQAGDLLAQIDPRTYQVALDQALGQQKQNEAQLQNAQRDLQRYQLLYKQNSIAKQQVDAQAALVQQLLGSRKSDQAAVDSATLQLSFTRITAPITGRLGLRKVDEGNMVNASNTDGIVTITQTQPISVLFTLPQAQLPEVLAQLRAGKNLVADLYDRDDQRKIASGQLVSVDNQIDVATGTVSFKARFENEDESLFPNQFVNVRLRVDAASALVIPTLAVQQGSIGAFVYQVNDDNKVHIQPIVVGRVDDQRIAVESGLSAGQRVVTEGVDRLREGSTVQIVTGDAAPAAAVPATGAPTRSGTGGSGTGRRSPH